MKNPYRAQSKVNPQRSWRREIATSVFRALGMAGLSGAQYQVVFLVIERTWGFNRKSHPISWAEFAEWTHLSRSTVARVIAELEAHRIILVKRNSTGSQVSDYLFNKHWDTWLTDLPLDASIILKGSPEAESSADDATGATDDTSTTDDTGVIHGTDQCHPRDRPVSKMGRTGVTPEPVTEPLKERKESRKKVDRKDIDKQMLFELWNSLNITQHRVMTDPRSMAILAALQQYSIEELCEAAVTYSKVYHGEEYYWDHRWTLEQFLNESNLDRFMHREQSLANFKIRQPDGARPDSNDRPGKTSGPEDYGITPVMQIVGHRGAEYRREHHRSPSYTEIQEWRVEAEREIAEDEEKQAAMEAEADTGSREDG